MTLRHLVSKLISTLFPQGLRLCHYIPLYQVYSVDFFFLRTLSNAIFLFAYHYLLRQKPYTYRIMSFSWRQALLATLVLTGTASAHSGDAENEQVATRSNKPRQVNLDSILGGIIGGAGAQGAGKANGGAADICTDHHDLVSRVHADIVNSGRSRPWWSTSRGCWWQRCPGPRYIIPRSDSHGFELTMNHS